MSAGFSLVYAACSAPAGWVCDRLPRGVSCSSPLSAGRWPDAQAASRTFGQLLGARLPGFSQAFSGPAAHTLISEAFPPAERATANAIYSSGIYFGAALASVSVALAHAIGWRATSLAVSATSLAACMLLVLVWPSRQSRAPGREAAAAVTPPRAQEPAAMAATAGGAASPFRRVLSVGSVRLLLAAVAVRFFAGFAIGAWTPPFYRAAFPSHTREFALWNAVIVAGGGSLSAVAGGVLCDRLSRGGRPHRAVLVPLIGSLVAAPFWVLAMQARSFYTSIGALFCAYTSQLRAGSALRSRCCKGRGAPPSGAPRRASSTWCRSSATRRPSLSPRSFAAATRCGWCSRCSFRSRTSPALSCLVSPAPHERQS